MNKIGIGILAFYGLDDLKRAVRSVQKHTKLPHALMVFDNSENDEVGEWVRHHAADVAYVRSPFNVGCARSRNEMAMWFGQRGIRHFVVMDQDVEVVGDAWAEDMLRVFVEHPDTGIASWHLAYRQMSPRYTVGKDGAVPEVPGMCCMYSLDAVKATGGWHPGYFFYRFDSDFCLHAATKGYKTRFVWPDMDKVRHNHPHRGVGRHPRKAAIVKASEAIFRRRAKQLGFDTTLVA